jgi:ankyrin repeat protein
VRDTELVVSLLLNSHAVNADLQDDSGNTSLHCAIEAQLGKCAEMLISYGADVTLV